MANNKFTPGPWKADRADVEMEYEGKKMSICTVRTNLIYKFHPTMGEEIKEAYANAQLIAAAPDLLAALEKALEHLEFCGYGDKWEKEVAEHTKLSSIIETAIKKAYGNK